MTPSATIPGVTECQSEMSDWIILNIEPSFTYVKDGERVTRLDRPTYTLQDMTTGQVKKLTCQLTDKWADAFLSRTVMAGSTAAVN
jgi:hypothetical protein